MPVPADRPVDVRQLEERRPNADAEGWLIVRIRLDGTVTTWNAAAAALYGLSAEQVVGQHYHVFAQGAQDAGIANALHAITTGTSSLTAVRQIRRPDGKTTTVAFTSVPTYDRSGAVTGIFATGIPLPATTGELPHATERFWRGVFDANPLAMAVVDPDTHVIGLNARFTELFGYSERETVGEPLYMLVGAPFSITQVTTRALATGRVVAYDAERRTKDGTRLLVHVETMGFDVGDGRQAVVVAYRLLTDQRQFEAQLVRAQRMEGVALVAAGVLHDINNLLVVILGQADLLAEVRPGTPMDAGVRDDVAVLRDAAHRAADLARTVGSFARPRDARETTVDVAALLTRLRPVLARLVGRQITVDYDVVADALPVRAVAAELEQVLLNLATNARDAMRAGGTLRVSAASVVLDATSAKGRGARPGRYVALDVSDSGAGMPADVAGRVFDAFYTTKGEGGTGLGLATVERIVCRTGGVVTVESKEGAGTTFHVLLPLLDAPA